MGAAVDAAAWPSAETRGQRDDASAIAVLESVDALVEMLIALVALLITSQWQCLVAGGDEILEDDAGRPVERASTVKIVENWLQLRDNLEWQS